MLQTNRNDLLISRKFIFGFQVGVGATFGQRNNSQFKFCLSGGISRAIDVNRPLNNIVYEWANIKGEGYIAPPFLITFQPEILIFRGGLGSSLMVGEREKIHVELRNSFSFVAGFSSVRSDGSFSKKNWGRPISKLEANSQAALYDPYGVSFTLGTTFVTGLDKGNVVRQQIGNANVGIGPFQADYSNDGPFFEKSLGLGDAYDRWWTGGGHLGFYLPNDHTFITEIVLRYDKFTGFQQNAYEVARQLRLDYIPYIDSREAFKNQGGYNISFGLQNNLSLGWNMFEVTRIDMQNLIHAPLNMPFHQPQLRNRSSMTYGYRGFNSRSIN